MTRSVLVALLCLLCSSASLARKGGEPLEHEVPLEADVQKVSYVLGFHAGVDLTLKDERFDTDSLVDGVQDAFAERKPLVDLFSTKGKRSYAGGYSFGVKLLKKRAEFDVETVVAGLRDGLAGRQSQLDDEESTRVLADLIVAVRRKQRDALATKRAIAEEEARRNLAEGEDFLAENAKSPGVVTLPSGLQYRVIVAGDGEMPTDESHVRVRFEGSLLDGTVFDQTDSRDVHVDKIIKGWNEALQLMKVGDTWELFVPAKLAYGGNRVGPVQRNSVLIFEVELLEIVE